MEFYLQSATHKQLTYSAATSLYYTQLTDKDYIESENVTGTHNSTPRYIFQICKRFYDFVCTKNCCRKYFGCSWEKGIFMGKLNETTKNIYHEIR